MSEERPMEPEEQELLERLVAGEALDDADRARLETSSELTERAAALESVIARLDAEGERERAALAHEEERSESAAIADAEERVRAVVSGARGGGPRWPWFASAVAAAIVLLVVWNGRPVESPEPRPPIMLGDREGELRDLELARDADGVVVARWKGALPDAATFEVTVWRPDEEYIAEPLFEQERVLEHECRLTDIEETLDEAFVEVVVRAETSATGESISGTLSWP